MQRCSICKSGTKYYGTSEENRNRDYKRLRRLRKARRMWVYMLFGWLWGGAEQAMALRMRMHHPGSLSPLVYTGPLIHIQGQRTPSTVVWKFHWLHHFHQLETRIIILIQKYFPISSATLWTGLFSHGDELSWPSRSYFESFSFCLQWTLLTNTLLFKCSNSVPFPIQCPLHWDL